MTSKDIEGKSLNVIGTSRCGRMQEWRSTMMKLAESKYFDDKTVAIACNKGIKHFVNDGEGIMQFITEGNYEACKAYEELTVDKLRTTIKDIFADRNDAERPWLTEPLK